LFAGVNLNLSYPRRKRARLPDQRRRVRAPM